MEDHFKRLLTIDKIMNLRIFAKCNFIKFAKIFSLESALFCKIKDSKFNYLKNYLLNLNNNSENNHWRKC